MADDIDIQYDKNISFRIFAVITLKDICSSHLLFRSWPTITLQPLRSKAVIELVRAELSGYGLMLTPEQESRILNTCRTPATCNPLFVMVLSSQLCK